MDQIDPFGTDEPILAGQYYLVRQYPWRYCNLIVRNYGLIGSILALIQCQLLCLSDDK